MHGTATVPHSPCHTFYAISRAHLASSAALASPRVAKKACGGWVRANSPTGSPPRHELIVLRLDGGLHGWLLQPARLDTTLLLARPIGLQLEADFTHRLVGPRRAIRVAQVELRIVPPGPDPLVKFCW